MLSENENLVLCNRYLEMGFVSYVKQSDRQLCAHSVSYILLEVVG
jgi:hypothetical protein